MVEPPTVVQATQVWGLPMPVVSASIGALVSGVLVLIGILLSQRGETHRLHLRLREDREYERRTREHDLQRAAYLEAIEHYDARLVGMIRRLGPRASSDEKDTSSQGVGKLALFAPTTTLRQAVRLDKELDRLGAKMHVRASELAALETGSQKPPSDDYKNRAQNLLSQSQTAASQGNVEEAARCLNQSDAVIEEWGAAIDDFTSVTQRALHARVDALEEVLEGIERIQPVYGALYSAMRKDMDVSGEECEYLEILDARSTSAIEGLRVMTDQMRQEIRLRLSDEASS